jgi:hypothetical protein
MATGGGAGHHNTAENDGEDRGLAYDSEPEYLARARARNASIRDQQGKRIQAVSAGHGDSDESTHAGTSGGLLSPAEEKALRRRSQSLVNLRNNAQHGNQGITISAPFRERSSELIRTPRTAPIPAPVLNGEQTELVPPLFMGTSVVLPEQPVSKIHQHHQAQNMPDEHLRYQQQLDQQRQIGQTSEQLGRSNSQGRQGTLGHTRRGPSRASIEAIEDPDKRREALFAALPPPARRSPTPARSIHMYDTGRVMSTELPAREDNTPTQSYFDRDLPQSQYLYQQQQEQLQRHEEIFDSRYQAGSGTISPTGDDYLQYEASRVIIGESDLLSPAIASERFPVVYGQAFSTTHESHEGEILNASASETDDLQHAGLYNRNYLRDSVNSTRSLAPLAEQQHYQFLDAEGDRRDKRTGSSDNGGSASRSMSSGSARILDLNEESFTNLVSITCGLIDSTSLGNTLMLSLAVL